MNRKRCAQMMVLLIGAAAALPASQARAAEAKFTLTKAVPQDVFLCMNFRHNPEQDFIKKYWDDVFAAAKECGIGEDIMGMVGSLVGDQQMEEVNRLKARAQELFAGVDWSALGDGEFAFAERWTSMKASPENVHVGPPDILVMFRGEKAEQNFEGLVAIVAGALDEIHKAAGPQAAGITIVRDEQHGARVALVPLVNEDQHGLNYNVALAQRDDLVIITIGNTILDDTLGLLAGDAKIAPISASQRYQNAFTKLPAPEDGTVYFDVQSMLTPIRSVIATAMAQASQPDDQFLNSKDSGAAYDLNQQALAAYRAGDKAKALDLINQAAAADPTDSRILYNQACFNAINGDKDAALAALTKAVDAGCHAPQLMATDADLAELRDAPEFQQALTKAKQQMAGENAAPPWRKLVDRLMDVPGMFDYVATVAYTQ
ncbi:MAG TPA: hypothetical protein P5572_19715, partial [Phycisphaerae bacterium]|nr:hypothetical protein [Phycisphaerae bacterium]